MNNDLTLVIMAAGMGSRFGGLKQIEPVGPNKEIIADYSVYDAYRAGFKKVVFIIREENYEYFKDNITSKFSDKIKVEFAFQELSMIPEDVVLPEGREKMLGTAHAIYCAKDKIDGDFVVINADDFYGLDSYNIAVDFFKNNKSNDYLTVSYKYCETSSKNGAVKRGVITEENGIVKNTLECEIREDNNKIIAKSLVDGKEFEIDNDTKVSMNFLCLRKSFLDILELEFDKFIHGDIDLKSEFLLPVVLDDAIKMKKIVLRTITTDSKWMGMTYKEDLDELKSGIKSLIDEGKYPSKLW